jgi:hypothetical protein
LVSGRPTWRKTASERIQQRWSSEARERERSQTNENRKSHMWNAGTNSEEQGSRQREKNEDQLRVGSRAEPGAETKRREQGPQREYSNGWKQGDNRCKAQESRAGDGSGRSGPVRSGGGRGESQGGRERAGGAVPNTKPAKPSDNNAAGGRGRAAALVVLFLNALGIIGKIN